MDKMKDLRAGIDEMRSVAKRLLSWASDLEESMKGNMVDCGGMDEGKAIPPPAVSDGREVSREEVKSLLTKKCAAGYSAQVKALIASYGVSSLSAVPEEALADLWDAALLLGEEESGGDRHAG